MKLRLDGKPYPKAQHDVPEPQRIFVISDVHGVFDVMRKILAAHKVVDSKNRWTFGSGRLLILGDVACRGSQVTQSYWFIRALEEGAKKAGGGVHMILGNHEALLMTGESKSTNQKYLSQPQGMPPLTEQYGTSSELGRWLRSRPIMVKVGDKLFLHGGISSEFLAKGLDIDKANAALRIAPTAELEGINAFLHGPAGPMWYRGMVWGGQRFSISGADLDKALELFKVKRIVVGHTLVEEVTALHGGKVLAVDANIQSRRGEGLYIEKEKYYRALPDGNKIEIQMGGSMAFATLAGGCFWGMEDLFRQQPGVQDVEVGYTGGALANPAYEQVKKGDTGHAEAIKITYDDSKTTYEELLRFFFKMHDPTTLNSQGGDQGSQYRSAIFYHDESQKEAAEKALASETASGFWSKPIVTEIAKAGQWWKAEEYHQEYLIKNPGGYTCHWVRK
jgi:methionine-S-sulfoxide reductase